MAIAVVEHYESKLQAPWTRPGLVARRSLVDRMLASPAPLAAVVAPPGYGKTILLAAWSERNERPSAWVSLDERDNDPVCLLGYLAAALERIESIDPTVLASLASPGMFSTARVIPLLASILSSRSTPFALVLDHVEAIRNQASIDVIVELALHLPAGSQLAVASRSDAPLPMARLRAQGQVVEIGVDDLAMDESEATELLAGAGVELGAAELTELVARTEGWPVGLYLGALALKSERPSKRAGLAFGGDDRLMADYVRAEILAELPASTTRFLRRTAVLDRLSGPLCDAVLGAEGSRQVLESFERSNLLLVPLDRQREWYRYHHLFQDLLRAELERTEPELVALLHDRAATWLEANGFPDVAIDHAQAAGDADRAARLFAVLAQRTYAAGRVGTALRWLHWFDERGLVERHPQIAMLASLADALIGQADDAERWADVASRGSLEGLLPDGSPLESWVAVLGAVLCRHGVAEMRADAELARERLAPGSSFQGVAAFLEAMSYFLDGELDAADPLFARAVDVCLAIQAMPTAVGALGERAAIAIERRDWRAAEAFVEQALSIVQEGHLDDYMTSFIVFAVAARTAAHRGEVAAAHELVAMAARLRPLCTAACPFTAQFLVQLGHAQLELADPAGARAALRQALDILHQRPDLGTVTKQVEELQSMVDLMRDGRVGASSLTVAELRLLPYLVTHFSFREIGERMFVSRHTVKTQAMSLYRKLGVSSRSEAILRAQEMGLLGT